MNFYLNSNKMFFLFILFFSTLISISSNSWFGCWIGLEINLLSFIPLISNSNNLLESEASLKYFLTQSIASINFLFSILMKMIILNPEINFLFQIIINFSLMMKMGSFPFHFWFPNMVEGMSWFNCFLLMTWQKISPLIIFSYFFSKNLLILGIIFNAIIGSLGGLNQTSLRKLMAFSSINNLSWMMSSFMISENLWIMFFLMYSYLIMIIMYLCFILNISFMNQFFLMKINPVIKILFSLNLISLGGLPPFIGFFPKWIIINFLSFNNFYLIIFIMILSSLIMLIFYIRIIYLSFFMNYISMKWFNYMYKIKSFYLINFLSFMSFLGMIFSAFFFF